MITIKDIAARLQVSPSTVGRALANDPRISATTKQKVNEVADEMGYVANLAARMMRGVSSNLVGLVLPDIRNGFYATIAHALSKCLQGAGYQLALSETDDDRMVELQSIRELASANVAGIIIVPTAKPHRETVRLLKLSPHVQLLRRHAAIGDQWFGIDDTQAIFEATRHLVELGHRRIGYIGGTDDLPTGSARLKGYHKALPGGESADPALVQLGAPGDPEFGLNAIRRLLSLSKRPTAIVAGSVQMTQGILEELTTQGLRAPDDLSVVGFGDELGFRWWGPGLTTVGLPVHDLATACGLWFVHQIRQNSGSPAPYTSISPATLILRGSTRKQGTAAKTSARAAVRGATV
ncbi:LacI family transcriptional regulator [Paraburkholderia piptadeniae]|uniref:LacI family transcriptional regulator n=1 Tax=Paraburkholderia piptadeniae TaxID=1701573 RepID=A0A1N7RS33_9BURK|nr:LacI family DNA-binding transcriptional regulator [Paraburkholderia piptadeniae]SIT37879.1 LacI family transcriptional regulator [Paraburkholderia piptadeniae]